MRPSIIKKIATCLCISILLLRAAVGQVYISGPNCVIPGQQYTYYVAGSFNVLVERTWCAYNGNIVETNTVCHTAMVFTSVNVVWSSAYTGAYLSLSSSEGSFGMPIYFTTPLEPGTMSTNGFQTIPVNTLPATIFCTAASGASCSGSGYVYQWQQSTDDATWTDIPGSTGQNLTYTTPVAQRMYFRRKATSTATSSVGYTYSAVVHVTYPLSSGSIGPASQTYVAGSAPSIYGSAATNGSCGSYSYQWQRSTDGTNFSDISGSTGLNCNTPTLTTTTYFRRRVSCGSETAYSNVVVVNIYPAFVAGNIHQGNMTIAYNASPGTLTAATPTGGNCGGNYAYQWQESVNGSAFTDIPGATSLSYAPGNLVATKYYRIKETCDGTIVYTNTITITVLPPPLVAGNISGNTGPITYNTLPGTLTGTAASGGNCSANYTYQWYQSIDGANYQAIAGATGLSFTPPALVGTTWYKRTVTCGSETGTTNVLQVQVNPQLFAGTILPSEITIQPGTTPGALYGSPARGGGCSGSYSYQWQQSTDSINFTNITGAKAQHYTPGNLTVTTWFRRSITCGTDVAYTNSSKITVSSAACTDINYVRTRTILKPGVTSYTAAGQLTDAKDVQQSTQYFDGLGRLQQSVVKNGSLTTGGALRDMVTVVVYDALGRESVSYMPFAAATADGNYKCNPIPELNAFNAVQFPGEQFYYGIKEFEASPLSRVTKAMSQGISWAGGNRGVESRYHFNTVADSVRIWNVTDVAGGFGTYSSPGLYPAGTLYKTITLDEHNKQVIEFKDKTGNVVLKKVQLTGSADNGSGAGHYGWLCTYSLYDDYNNLRCVIQPKGAAFLNAAGWPTPSTGGGWGDVLNEQCFRYEYDHRNRMITKRIPGAEATQMVYDARNRVVMTQDGNLRTTGQKQWLVIQYDHLNRPAATYKITDAANYNNAAYHRQQAATSSSYPTIGSYTNELLIETHYDNYTGIPAGFSSASLYASGYGTYLNAPATDYPDPLTLATNVKDKVTWMKTKVLGGSQYITTCNLYDNDKRLIQVQTLNYSGGMDVVSSQYSFSGLLLRSHLRHAKAGSNAQTHELATRNTYDALGRLSLVEKNLNGLGWKQVSATAYNVLGQVDNKTIGNNLEVQAYEYNIRGWLLGVNRQFVNDAVTKYFGFELSYDKTTSVLGSGTYGNALYNGNIGGMIWKSYGDKEKRKYDFAYDNANRLLSADFNQRFGTSWAKIDPANAANRIDFSVSNLGYDANGNILSMGQQGWKAGGSALIDNMTYTYMNNGNSNKLLAVTENPAIGSTDNKLGDFTDKNTALDDYTYDDNGNLVTDKNKKIAGIVYNHLNLPQLITINKDDNTLKGTIDYLYDAAGARIQKTVTDNLSGSTIRTLYLAGFEYKNDTLQQASHEEGRIRYARKYMLNGSSSYQYFYDYFLKDHLGNVRMVLTEQSDTAQYMATMEAAYRVKEDQLFYNIPQTSYARALVPGGYPSDATTNPNDSLARLNGSGRKIGPAIVLKVMGGDRVDIGVKSFYRGSGAVGAPADPVADIVAALAAGIVGAAGESKGTLATLNNSSSGPLAGALNNFRNGNNSTPANKPKAYLNWLLLDDQLQYVAGSSGAAPIQDTGVIRTLTTPGQVTMAKNGFLYIYVSNETPNRDVFFDNLSIQHITGALLEETHYYPFGLTMAGISSTALKTTYAENKYRWNKGSELQNKEFSDGSGLEWYATPLRSLDPQLGRWWQIDSKPDYAQSLYSSMGNNPISYNDPLGDTLRISFRTSLFGRRQEVIYNNGTLTNSDGSAYAGRVRGYLGRVVGAIQSLNATGEGSATVSDLQSSTNNFTIRRGGENRFVASNTQRSFGMIPEVMAASGNGGGTIAGGSGGTIYWNPNIGTSGMNAAGNTSRPAFIGLGHEMAHARDANNGTLYPSENYTNPITGVRYEAMFNGLKKSEWRAVYSENLMRMQSGVPLRVNYGLSDDGETVSGTGPSTVLNLGFLGIPVVLPLNYQVR